MAEEVGDLDDLRLITMTDLAALLAYPTVRALHRAIARDYLQIPIFRIPHRKGLFTRRAYVTEYLKKLEENQM